MSLLATLAMTLGPKIIQEVAPDLVGKMFGAKGETAERVARAATEAALRETGMAAGTPPENVMTALRGDSEALARVQVAVEETARAELAAETERQRVQASEMDSARQMYAAGDNGIQKLLVAGAFLFASAGLALVGYMNVRGIDPTTLTVTIITASMGPVLTVFGFFFGSSIGSKQKTEQIGRHWK